MEYQGKIIFCEETVDILFPEDFHFLLKKIGEMTGLPKDEVLKKILLYYNDEDKDKVVLIGDDDYKIFLNYHIKENKNKKEKITIHLELQEYLEYLVKKISQEIINYKEKISNEVKIDNKDELDNENDLNDSPNIEQNDDSKSLILAPYNSYVSLNNSLKEEVYDDLKEINIMNDICQFEPQAQMADKKYAENNHIYN